MGGRRVGQADAAAGRRGADRRPRHHQRRERDHHRALQRLAARGHRRAGHRTPVGAPGRCRSSTTCRSSAPVTKSAATVEATGDIAKLVGEAVAAAVTPHRGPDVRRHPARRVLRSRRRRRAGRGVRRRGRSRPRRGGQGGRPAGRRGTARGRGRRRRVLGRRVGRVTRPRSSRSDADLRQRAGPWLPAGRSRAGLCPHARRT